MSAAVKGGMSRGRSLPCTRTRGALLVERCRSLPPSSIIFFKSSLSVMPAIFPPYRTVSRNTSSMVVSPAATLMSPLRRKVIIPSSRAFFLSSIADAPTRINSRSSSLISITS